MLESVHYPISVDSDGEWVHISEARRGISYSCPECQSPFVVRLGSVRTHHFARRPGYIGECSGESGFHNLAKHLLAYHFEKEPFLELKAKCSTCSRVFPVEKKITDVHVEKGDNDYRPDVTLALEGGEVVACEVVYKNPIGDKFKVHRERRAALLIWTIHGQVAEVPPLVKWNWDDSEAIAEMLYVNRSKKRIDSLVLFASPIAPQHACSPYGVAYICETDCWKCGGRTNVAILSSWYPMWGDVFEMGQAMGSFNYFTNIRLNMIPKGFWTKVNGQFNTRLMEAYSQTASMKYLMNHCSVCGAKLGDFYLYRPLAEHVGDVESLRRVVEFELTPWERQAFMNRPLRFRPGEASIEEMGSF